jgi:NhaA family Na+:H+ antiporter
MPDLRQFALDHLLLLPLGALAAMVWANASAESYYEFAYTIDFWVNDVAMVLFFGLLMKEVVEAREAGGVLHSWRKTTMPAFAAAGAAIVPAAILPWFVRLTNEPMLERAWPIAMTTDLALSYFVARFIFRRHPVVPFVLLLGLVTNAAAFLIAPLLVSPADLRLVTGGAVMALAIGTAAAFRNAGVRSFWPYLIAGGGMSWIALYSAGIHPGLALVPIVPFLPHARRDAGFFVDARAGAHDALSRFEIAWRYPVHAALFLFGLVNGGVALGAFEIGGWGMPLAVVVGKPVGILAAVGIAVIAGFHLPHRVGWRELVVASVAAASGFTMALFMAGAMLAPGQMLAMTRMGVLLSVTAAPLAILLARVLRVGRFAR